MPFTGIEDVINIYMTLVMTCIHCTSNDLHIM
jgi:hypothetical protein